MNSMIATLEIIRHASAIALCIALAALAIYGLYTAISKRQPKTQFVRSWSRRSRKLQSLWSRSRYRRKVSGKVSEGMFIACMIGAMFVIPTVFCAVILFIACIIDQHKWEHGRDDSRDENSDGRV